MPACDHAAAQQPAAGGDADARAGERAAAPFEPWSQVIWAWLGWNLAASALGIVVGVLAGYALAAAGAPPVLAQASAFWAGIAAGTAILLRPALRGLRAMPPPATPPRPIHPAAVAALALAAALGGAAVATWLVGPPAAEAIRAAGRAGGGMRPLVAGAVAALVYAVVCGLAPVAEELFYRGRLWRRLEPHGARFAALLTAALFLVAHLRGPAGTLALLPLAALLTWTRHRAGTPRPGIALHAAWNAGVLLGPGLRASLPG